MSYIIFEKQDNTNSTYLQHEHRCIVIDCKLSNKYYKQVVLCPLTQEKFQNKQDMWGGGAGYVVGGWIN